MSVEILSVSELTQQLRDCLEGNFPCVAVRGEISNCTRAASGHIYLALKDEAAQIRGVLWRRQAQRLRFDLQDGLEVVAVGAIELYPARGTYQLVIEELLPQGLGPLELAFRQMHARLLAEGLFAPSRKRPLPRFPRRVALVTSPTGAAVRDMLQVISRRWPCCDVVILPVPVQGDGAAARIAAAVQYLPRVPRIDVAIVGRGGGSLEDLWAFNEEVVARAIAACPIPIVSGVGHEIDVTICDLVADRRALTPSEAAELVVPDRVEVEQLLQHVERRLAQRVRELAAAAGARLRDLADRRVLKRPLDRVQRLTEQVDELAARLVQAMRVHQRHCAGRLSAVAASLDALSPLKVLERGFSITRAAESGQVIRAADQVAIGMQIATRVHRGELLSRIEEVRPSPG